MASGIFFKFCETLWMVWAFSILGINYSVLGPTLLDLQLFLKQDLETLSTIPLSSGCGETAGMFLTLWLSRFGHKRLQIGIALLLASTGFAVIPITNSYVYVDVIFFMVGCISAIPSCFLMDVCSELWSDKGTTFQFILVGVSLGAILTPLVVEPFLCHKSSEYGFHPSIVVKEKGKNETCLEDNLLTIQAGCLDFNPHAETNQFSEIANITDASNHSRHSTSSTLSLMNYTSHANINYDINVHLKLQAWVNACGNITNNQTDNAGPTDLGIYFSHCCALLNSTFQCAVRHGPDVNNTTRCTEKDSNVRAAYVVLGLMLLPASLAFFYYWWRRDSKWATDHTMESQRFDHMEFDHTNHGLLRGGIFYTLLFLSYLPLVALTVLFSTYLTAFGVHSRLHLPKSTMVFMNSVFWLSTLVGRIISTAVTPFVGNFNVIIINFVGLIISALLLVFFAPYYVPMLWVSTIVFGIFVCPYEGAGIAWSADYVGMSSNLVVLSWVSVSVGNLAFPFIGGIMFDNIGPSAFLYLLAGLIVFIVLMFGLMNISARYLKRQQFDRQYT